MFCSASSDAARAINGSEVRSQARASKRGSAFAVSRLEAAMDQQHLYDWQQATWRKWLMSRPSRHSWARSAMKCDQHPDQHAAAAGG